MPGMYSFLLYCPLYFLFYSAALNFLSSFFSIHEIYILSLRNSADKADKVMRNLVWQQNCTKPSLNSALHNISRSSILCWPPSIFLKDFKTYIDLRAVAPQWMIMPGTAADSIFFLSKYFFENAPKKIINRWQNQPIFASEKGPVHGKAAKLCSDRYLFPHFNWDYMGCKFVHSWHLSCLFLC